KVLEKQDPQVVARNWLKANPAILERWLDGATTFNGEDGLSAVRRHIGLQGRRQGERHMFKKTLRTAALALGLSTGAQAADQPTLTSGYVDGWDESVAAVHVVVDILQHKLGYPVEIKAVEAAIMWQGVARGDLDGTLSAWLPATHGEYYARLKDKVELVNVNYEGARIGLVVPDYVEARTIADLNNLKKALRGQITGIDAGAGVMR